MKQLFLFPALLLASCAAVPTTREVDGAYAVAPRSFPAVEAFVAQSVANGTVPAMSVAIGVGDEPARFYSAGHSAADGASPPASPDTLWRVYSMTKPVTGIAAMILVNDGKLRLDQEIGDILPAFRMRAASPGSPSFRLG